MQVWWARGAQIGKDALWQSTMGDTSNEPLEENKESDDVGVQHEQSNNLTLRRSNRIRKKSSSFPTTPKLYTKVKLKVGYLIGWPSIESQSICIATHIKLHDVCILRPSSRLFFIDYRRLSKYGRFLSLQN
jgi:hypothetical protein